MKITFILTTVILLSTISSQAQKQSYTVQIDVRTASLDSIFTEIYLSNDEDNSTVAYADFGYEGRFIFEEVEPGTYFLSIKSVGYATLADTIKVVENSQLDYELELLNESLGEITILGLRDAVKITHGDVTADVENSILANQSSINDLLQQLPRILIDPSSNAISIVGSGNALLYFDNQRITTDQLQAIPVDVIKNIEIIQHPPAKYEADGQAVIVIHRKRNSSNGYNGSVSNMNSLRRGYNNQSSASINLRKNRLEFQANATVNFQSFWESFESSFELINEERFLKNKGISRGPRKQFIGGVGLYYMIKGEEYISSNVQYTTQNSAAPITNTSSISEDGSVRNFSTFSDSKSNRYFISANVNYNKPLKVGSLFVGLQYTDYLRGLDDKINIIEETDDLELIQLRDQEFTIQSSAIRLDYTVPTKVGRWELGTSYSNAIADAIAGFDFIETGEEFMSNYDYSELNLALYSQLNGDISNMNYSIGIRAEKNDVIGKFREDATNLIERDKVNYFPNVQLDIPIDSLNSIRVFYRSSISRPNYLNASSITTFLTPFLEYSRNANLVSTLRHRTGVSYQHNRTSMALSGFSFYNPTNTLAVYNDESERITLSPENVKRETGINLDFSTNLRYKSWNTSLFLRGTYSKLVDNRYEIGSIEPYLYFNINQRYVLPFNKPRITLGSVFWGLTPQKRNLINRAGIYSLGFNAQATYNQWIISINVHDALNLMRYSDTYQVNNIAIQSTFVANSRGIELMVRYNFGGKWKSSYKNKDIDDNLDRI